MLTHVEAWYVGWGLLLAAFVSGAGVGMFFHRDDFLGGYGSFRRRLFRLGHIAMAELGLINLLFAVSPWPVADSALARGAGAGLIVGAISMPIVCALVGWRGASSRGWFAVPVVSLTAAVVCVLWGGPR